jgi:NAD-dependent SIR2 family protein deacetylase
MDDLLDRAAEVIRRADALVIAAGAGMGVDSGLPDFRGREGFWRAYPPLAKLGLDFASIANPRWFRDDPELAWGFYGHRLNLYRSTKPHEGYEILKAWAGSMPRGYFVFTSNVDGQFARAGFHEGRIEEVHGSIHALQCLRECGVGVYRDDSVRIELDESTMRATGDLPRCPVCASLARPNILMFGDGGWDSTVSQAQRLRFQEWLRPLRRVRIAVVECGAGTAISTVRSMSQGLLSSHDATLIRINVRDPEVPRGQIGLALGARDALAEIDYRVTRKA